MRMLFTLVALCIVYATVSASQTPSHSYERQGISRMFLDAHAPDRPPRYSRSEIKTMIHNANTSEDYGRLAGYFDYQSLEFEHKADEQLKELEQLLAQHYHARSYPTHVEYMRDLLREYRAKAKVCSARASEYRAQTESTEQNQ